MPIYEYQCQSCQHELEALQKISDEPLRDCPECGKPELRKRVSAVAFRLKGAGWYETDFKTGDKKNLAGGDGQSAQGGGGADGGKDAGATSSPDSSPSGKTNDKGGGSSEKTSATPGSGKSGASKAAG